MKTRLSIGFVLGIIILPGLVIIDASPLQAQRGSHSYCDSQARRYADRNYDRGTLRGAAKGAITGTIIGAIAGDAGAGAAAGAGLGAITGDRRSPSWRSLYQREYNQCMRSNR